MPKLVSAVACAALLVATGCGSTVEMRGTATGQGAGLSVPTGQTTGVDAPTGSGPAPTVGSSQAPTGSGIATVATPGGGSTGVTATDATPVRGTSPLTSLRVGVVYLKGLDQAYKAAGASSASSDSHADYEAVFKDINAHGGANGTRLVPSYYAVDASSSASQADQLEAACQNFTTDHPTDVVLTYAGGSGLALAHCLQKHHIPLINGFPEADTSDALLAANPLYWEPAQLSLNEVGRLLAKHLIGSHWVDGRWPSAPSCASVTAPRIGVVTIDRPEWRDAYNKGLAPAFKAAGHPVYDVSFIAIAGNTAQQVSQASAGAQSTVLKFASDCIDHVVFVSAVALDYLFMDVADQQQYRPRYGLSSLEAPPVIVPNLANPSAQLHGAMGPGWAPYADVSTSELDAAAKQPAKACLDILRKAGLAPTDNNSTILTLPSCEGPMFLREIVSRWVTSAPGTTMLQVVNGLGSSYRPAGSYGSTLTSNRHDGANGYRGFGYVDSCTCFRYSTALRAV